MIMKKVTGMAPRILENHNRFVMPSIIKQCGHLSPVQRGALDKQRKGKMIFLRQSYSCIALSQHRTESVEIQRNVMPNSSPPTTYTTSKIILLKIPLFLSPLVFFWSIPTVTILWPHRELQSFILIASLLSTSSLRNLLPFFNSSCSRAFLIMTLLQTPWMPWALPPSITSTLQTPVMNPTVHLLSEPASMELSTAKQKS